MEAEVYDKGCSFLTSSQGRVVAERTASFVYSRMETIGGLSVTKKT
jgi:hypothetical protein